MVRVRVRGFTVIRDLFGSPSVEVDVDEPATVQTVLRAVVGRCGRPMRELLCDPASGEFVAFPIRLDDEVLSSSLDRDRPVGENDELTIMFPVGGG